LATDLTEEINALKSEVEEERRRHAAEMAETRAHYEGCDQQSVNQQAQLKDKIRDLENCLHEMQEEFEEVSNITVGWDELVRDGVGSQEKKR